MNNMTDMEQIQLQVTMAKLAIKNGTATKDEVRKVFDRAKAASLADSKQSRQESFFRLSIGVLVFLLSMFVIKNGSLNPVELAGFGIFAGVCAFFTIQHTRLFIRYHKLYRAGVNLV